MKRLFLFMLMSVSLMAEAQKFEIEQAILEMRQKEYEAAKVAIDKAAQHPQTSDDARMYWIKGQVYTNFDTIPRLAATAPEANKIAIESLKNSIDRDTRKRYVDGQEGTQVLLLNNAFSAFNKAYGFYNDKEYTKAIEYYKLVLSVIPYDKNGDMARNNLSEETLILYTAYAALQGDMKEEAMKNFQLLIDKNYQDYSVYVAVDRIHLEAGDTAKALEVLTLARQRFSTNMELVKEELFIYQSMGKVEVLLAKLNEAIEVDPNNHELLFVRGTVYEAVAADIREPNKANRAKITDLKEKSKSTASSTKKAEYKKQIKALESANNERNAEADSILKFAETDYLAAIEMVPDYYDAYFNLGAFYFNQTAPIIEIMNELTYSQQEQYDKLKAETKELFKKALDYFIQAEEIIPIDKSGMPQADYADGLYLSLQQVYANLDNLEKSGEYKKKRAALQK